MLTILGAYGHMIAANTAEITNNVGFISSIAACTSSGYINDPDNGLSCCFEDDLNKGIFKHIFRYLLKKNCDKQNLSISESSEITAKITY